MQLTNLSLTCCLRSSRCFWRALPKKDNSSGFPCFLLTVLLMDRSFNLLFRPTIADRDLANCFFSAFLWNTGFARPSILVWFFGIRKPPAAAFLYSTTGVSLFLLSVNRDIVQKALPASVCGKIQTNALSAHKRTAVPSSTIYSGSMCGARYNEKPILLSIFRPYTVRTGKGCFHRCEKALVSSLTVSDRRQYSANSLVLSRIEDTPRLRMWKSQWWGSFPVFWSAGTLKGCGPIPKDRPTAFFRKD